MLDRLRQSLQFILLSKVIMKLFIGHLLCTAKLICVTHHHHEMLRPWPMRTTDFLGPN
jgi:cell division protein FtsL